MGPVWSALAGVVSDFGVVAQEMAAKPARVSRSRRMEDLSEGSRL